MNVLSTWAFFLVADGEESDSGMPRVTYRVLPIGYGPPMAACRLRPQNSLQGGRGEGVTHVDCEWLDCNTQYGRMSASTINPGAMTEGIRWLPTSRLGTADRAQIQSVGHDGSHAVA